MTVTEQVAYLKGLAAGLEIGTSNKEGRLLCEMLNTLEALADAVVDLQKKQVTVSGDAPLDMIKKAITDAGYEVKE